jgi:hypothetical protein
MYIHILSCCCILSCVVFQHPMSTLWSDPILASSSDPILSSTGDPILFSLGTPYFFFGGEPPGDRAWAFPIFKFGGNVIPYLGVGIWILRRRQRPMVPAPVGCPMPSRKQSKQNRSKIYSVYLRSWTRDLQ